MPWAVAAVAAVGVLSAVNNYQTAQASARATDAQAALYAASAVRQREIAALNEQRNRAAASKIMGQQRARLAAAGIEPSSGSALLSQTELARDSELGALLVRNQGDAESQMIEYQGNLLSWQAREKRSQAGRGLFLGILGAGAGAAGGLADKGYFDSSPGPSTSLTSDFNKNYTIGNYQTGGGSSFGTPTIGNDFYGGTRFH